MDGVFEAEWLESNSAVAYPFVDYVYSDPALEDGIAFNLLVADASISYRASTDHVIQLKHFNRETEDTVSITLFDVTANKTLVEVSGAEQVDTVYGNWLSCKRVFTYPTVVGQPAPTFRLFATIIFNMTMLQQHAIIHDPYDNINATFLERCHHRLGPGLTSINVAPDLIYYGRPTSFPLDKDGLTLVEGYNIELTQEEESATDPFTGSPILRPAKIITISANPGSGRGKRIPECGAAGAIRTINSIPPADDGRFHLLTDSCQRLSKTTADQETEDGKGLVWNHDCEPCCECLDYVSVYEAMRKLVQEGNVLQGRIDAVKNDLVTLVSLWNQGEERVKTSVRVYPRNGWIAAIQGIVYNSTKETLTNLGLTFTLTSPIPFQLVNGSGYVTSDTKKNTQTDPDVYDNIIQFNWAAVTLKPGGLIVYSYELFFPDDTLRIESTEITVKMVTTLDGWTDEMSSVASGRLKGYINQ